LKKSQMFRIVEFDQCVREARYPNINTFSADQEVCSRTLARDIEYLKERLGAPLAYCPKRRGYYYTRPWELPAIIRGSAFEEDKVAWIYREITKLNPAQRDLLFQTLAEDRRETSPSLRAA
jgi:predicted DNA-binding transcriptional regulator YafY